MDVKHLEIGDSVKVGDIAIPENIVKVSNVDTVAIFIEKMGEKIEEEDEDVVAAEPVADAVAAE